MSAIILRLDRQTLQKLKDLAEATGWRRADLVAEAVRRFVECEYSALLEQQAKETSRQSEGEGEGEGACPARPRSWKITV